MQREIHVLVAYVGQSENIDVELLLVGYLP